MQQTAIACKLLSVKLSKKISVIPQQTVPMLYYSLPGFCLSSIFRCPSICVVYQDTTGTFNLEQHFGVVQNGYVRFYVRKHFFHCLLRNDNNNNTSGPHY